MVYRVIGLMSGSSLDGLDIAYAQLMEERGKWTYEILETACIPYSPEWEQKLKNATALSALDYQLLHVDLGHYIGLKVNEFIEKHRLHFQIQLVVSHGHTSFHMPALRMTAQLGDGASIAAVTGIHTVTDLRAVDMALGGQGAPIVPIGEKLFWDDYDFFLNIGGIANISCRLPAADAGESEMFIAFDVCPANKVLNLLAQELGKKYDEGGMMAASGIVRDEVLKKLNDFEYYHLPYPKSLANEFGMNELYPLLKKADLSVADALATYNEHIIIQLEKGFRQLLEKRKHRSTEQQTNFRLLVTGGGAHNRFLVQSLQKKLDRMGISVLVPDAKLIDYKEALVMCLIGTLRWRGESNVLASVTGAARNSVGGAVWEGNE